MHPSSRPLNAPKSDSRFRTLIGPLCAVVRERLAHMDEFHAFVCGRLDDALGAWTEQRRRQRATGRDAAR